MDLQKFLELLSEELKEFQSRSLLHQAYSLKKALISDAQNGYSLTSTNSEVYKLVGKKTAKEIQNSKGECALIKNLGLEDEVKKCISKELKPKKYYCNYDSERYPGERCNFSTNNLQGLSAHIRNVHKKITTTYLQTHDNYEHNNQFKKWFKNEKPIYLKVTKNANPNITSEELRQLVYSGEYTPTIKMPSANITKGFLYHKHSDTTIESIKSTIARLKEEGKWHTWIGRKKLSYPEQYFFDFFNSSLSSENMQPINNKYQNGYWMDFAWDFGNNKVYIEVDGEQHYTENGKTHDRKRTEKLAADGWTLLERIRWSEYQAKSRDEKEKDLNNLLNKIKKYKPAISDNDINKGQIEVEPVETDNKN